MSSNQLPDDFRRRFMALHTALFCDSMDRMGLEPAVMDHRIRPVYTGAVIVGRALPVLWAPVYRPPEHPYEHLFEAYRALEADDVFVMTTSGFVSACHIGTKHASNRQHDHHDGPPHTIHRHFQSPIPG